MATNADRGRTPSYQEFLENYPLLRKCCEQFGFDSAGNLHGPPIRRWCPACDSFQTFRLDYHQSCHEVGLVASTELLTLRYACAGCEGLPKECIFYVEVSSEADVWIRKVGQLPPWNTTVDRKLARALGDHLPLFEKAMVCESQSYGVGAFAYYRRVVEDLMEEMLVDLLSALEGDERAVFQKAVEKARGSKRASEKLNLVKETLPSFLKPGNVNPFGVMYGALSEGLHKRSDSDCLTAAAEIREALSFVLLQLSSQKENSERFARTLEELSRRPDMTN